VLLTVMAAGCGGSQTNQTNQTNPRELMRGKQVFKERCGNCHGLKDAGTRGGVGPDLDAAKPDAGTVRTKVTNGSGAMPAFKGQLSQADIRAVAQYVSGKADH
jgi:cytochrome c6